MSLNEWGYFLAGATAPIAFLWLIIGYALQRKELRLNTEVLTLTQIEASRQAVELEKQSKYMASQAKIADAQHRIMRSEHQDKRMQMMKSRHVANSNTKTSESTD